MDVQVCRRAAVAYRNQHYRLGACFVSTCCNILDRRVADMHDDSNICAVFSRNKLEHALSLDMTHE
jgi:hypothetical protein